MTQHRAHELEELAAKLVERARKGGADVAEASARRSREISARVRLGQPELVEEAGNRGVSLRVIRGQRVAVTGTSDLSDAGIDRCIEDALALAELSEPDPSAGPVEPELLARPPFPDLDLYDDRVEDVDARTAIRLATEAEDSALKHDSRVTNSEGGSFARTAAESVLVLSSGFVGHSRGTYASLSVSPVVLDEGDKRRRGSYWSARRHLEELESPEEVGAEAARRTLAKLGARKVSTTQAPVVFDPDMARSILGTFAGCILGGSVWRQSTYLMEREGTVVASPLVSVIDDPLVPRAPGSSPFDGEGVARRKHQVVQDGKLLTFLLDSYSARKLNRTTTGNASRGGGSIGASTTNFILQPGAASREDIIATTKRGLYVTDMMGFGFNGVTGDFSRGAAGFWIEDGKLAFPVSEVTISGNLDQMLKDIDMVGKDLVFKTSTAAPTFRIAKMTIAGE